MKTTMASRHIKILTSMIRLVLFCLLPLSAWAANRTVTIDAPSYVSAGQSFTVANYASTDADDGEQVGFFHAQYSTDGGANWTWFAGDVDAGTFVTRHAYITAGGSGSTIIVRVKIAFRGGYDGDVDYNGSGIDWGGSWDNWQEPPTKYAYINVTAPANRTVTINAPESVNAGQSFTVPSFASTDASDGEQIGFFHAQYSTDGGGNWTWFAGDMNAGGSATRHANITAGGAGSQVIVRVRIAFRGGFTGDVDYNGSGIDWGGSWDNWQEPPTKYATINVTPPPPLHPPGELWGMGFNSSGQLGIGNTTNQLSPVQIASGVGSYSAGYAHSLFVKWDGTLWGMGSNNVGQLGIGNTTNQSSPALVAFGVTSSAAGDDHSLFLKSNGTLWSMGYNAYYELGDGTDTQRLSPVQVATNVGGAQLSAGWSYSQFVRTDGTLWRFGLDLSHLGQTFQGFVLFVPIPQQFTSGVTSADAGSSTSCLFRKTNGTLWAMGWNAFGQLGDGTATNRLSPVQVASDVAAIAAGGAHSLFLKTDGTLWAMGFNSVGQLGDGTTTNRLSPVQVASGVASIAAGANHSLFRY